MGLIPLSASLTGNQPSKENHRTSIVNLRRRFYAIKVYKQKHRLVGLIPLSASLTGNWPSKENLHTSIVKLRRRFGAIKIYLNTPSNSTVAWAVVLSKAMVLLLIFHCLQLFPMFVGFMCLVLAMYSP